MTTADLVRAIHRAGVASALAEDRPFALLWHGLVWAWMTMRLERRLRGLAYADLAITEGGQQIRVRFDAGVVIQVSPADAS